MKLAGLLTTLTLALLAGCSGEDGAMEATLRDGGCEYDGPTTVAPGPVAIDVINDSNRFAAFEVVTLSPEATTADIDPFLDRAWRELRRTGHPLADDPPWESVRAVPAIPDEQRVLEFVAEVGSYLLFCVVATDEDFGQSPDDVVPPEEIHVAAELRARQ